MLCIVSNNFFRLVLFLLLSIAIRATLLQSTGTVRLYAESLTKLNEIEIDYNRPASYFLPMPSDIVPMSLAANYFKMHNYIITMSDKLFDNQKVDKNKITDMPYLSEALKEAALDSENDLERKGRKIQINAGFEYYNWHHNWYFYLKYEENKMEFQQRTSVSNLHYEMWRASTYGIMFASAYPLIRKINRGYISLIWGLGYLVNEVKNGFGSNLVSNYHNRFSTVPMQAGLIAEWNQLRIVNLSFWCQAYYPAYIYSKNSIDRQLSQIDAWFRYGIDIRGHLDIYGLGVQTTLTGHMQRILRNVRLGKEGSSSEDEEKLDNSAIFNLSLSLPLTGI